MSGNSVTVTLPEGKCSSHSQGPELVFYASRQKVEEDNNNNKKTLPEPGEPSAWTEVK